MRPIQKIVPCYFLLEPNEKIKISIKYRNGESSVIPTEMFVLD